MEEKTRAVGELLAFNPLDAKGLLNTFGVIGVWIIMFVETGLLVGFFFPGDSLLFLAGVGASSVAEELLGTKLSLTQLLIGAPLFAIAGAQLGHYLGARYGRQMFNRPNSRLFKKEYVEKAEYYFVKFGPAKAVVLARFIPIVPHVPQPGRRHHRHVGEAVLRVERGRRRPVDRRHPARRLGPGQADQ